MRSSKGSGGVSLLKIRLERCVRIEKGLWDVDGAQARRLLRSLRLRDGAEVEGLLPDGPGEKLVMKLEIGGASCRLRETGVSGERGGPEITLLIGLLKTDQFDAVLKSSSEVGVKIVMPMICERSIPRFEGSDAARKLKRWQRLLDEGTCVSGAVFPPRVLTPAKPEDIPWGSLPAERYAGFISEDSTPIAGVAPTAREVVFAVGPEGDWSDAEKSILLENKFVPLSLGPRIMRASTAAVAGCAWFWFGMLNTANF
jgi:16S rRNA (uracil1498-N3)-methyltransferase